MISKAIGLLKHADLDCPICFDLLIEAQTTACGHAFCRRCLDELVLYSYQCPLCRGSTRRPSHLFSAELRKAVEKFVEASNATVRRAWLDRVAEAKQWEAQRRLPALEIGQQLDVLDSESVWCVAVVKELHRNPGHARTLLVHYEGWDAGSDEFICENSPRLAPAGFYTSRADVPKYAVDFPARRSTRLGYLIMGRPFGSIFVRNIDVLEMIPTLRFRTEPAARDREPDT